MRLVKNRDTPPRIDARAKQLGTQALLNKVNKSY